MISYQPSDLEKAAEAQPTSPDLAVVTNPSPDAGGEMHPVIRILQERDLGKVVLGSAIVILGIVVAGKDRLAQSEVGLVLTPACLGFIAILYGIILRDTLPRFAQIVEPLGIALVAVAFFAVAGFFMPVELLWVPALCIVLLCLLPLIVRLYHTA